MRVAGRAIGLGLALVAGIASAASMRAAEAISEKRLELLFRPPLAEQVALSPDGRYLAYTEHAGSDLAIRIFDLDRMALKTRIVADEDRPILHSKEKARMRLRFLEWGEGNRLVFAPEIESVPTRRPGREPVLIEPVLAVDADGTRPRELVNGRAFEDERVRLSGSADSVPIVRMRRTVIHGFVAGDRRHLLVEAIGWPASPGPSGWFAHDTEIYTLDVLSGKLERLHGAPATGIYAYDWNGVPRVMRSDGENGTAPRYLVRVGTSTRWQPLDAVGPDAGHFNIPPEKYFGERAFPLGLDFDPNVLLYASNVGRDTLAIYGLDLTSGRRTPLAIQHPAFDLAALDDALPSERLIYDPERKRFAGVRAAAARPFTAWLDAELAQIQRQLEDEFPDRTVEVLAWNEARSRLLFRVTGGTEPGRLFLYDRGRDLATELMRSAPWLPRAGLHATKYVEFAGPENSTLGGYLTLPRAPRLNPPPLIVWFAPGLPPVGHREFDAQAQVLADLGFMVLRLNNRGVLGAGRRARDALRRDPNGVPVADAFAALDWLGKRHAFDRRRVATLGEGLAGYFAIRVAETHPEAFRCAVAFDPILNFARWPEGGAPTVAQRLDRTYLEGEGAEIGRLSLPLDQLNLPVFVALRRPENDPETAIAAGVSGLKLKLKLRGLPCQTIEYDDAFAGGAPAARARVYRALEEFFNLNLYNPKVIVGPTRVVR